MFRSSLFFSLLAVSLFVISGCQQTRPPTAEGLRRIKARTASGPVNTKLEAKSQPEIPRAGEVSIWDLKVFDIKDKPDGTRQEWKFFNDLPQVSTQATLSEVLMNAWIISRDGEVFLPARVRYQAYGSFNTDWTIPRPGKYTLFVEYQPRRKGKIVLPVEMAKWNFSVAPGKSVAKPVKEAPYWAPTRNPLAVTVGGARDGEPAGTLSIENLPPGRGETRSVAIQGAPAGAAGMRLTALTSGGAFLHFPRGAEGKFQVSFPASGIARVWAYFTLNDVPYAASINHHIS